MYRKFYSMIGNSILRKVVSSSKMKQAISILKEKARSKNTMWSRRAQEYDEKINSGKPVLVAEVIRDLHRKENQAEQSHSERQLYEQALDRLGREMAVVFSINDKAAIEKIEKALAKKNLKFIKFKDKKKIAPFIKNGAIKKTLFN